MTPEQRKEKYKKKIAALLAKTTENGASEEEAAAAMKLAQKLMTEHMITEADVKDPYLLEKCIKVQTPMINCNFKTTTILGALAKMFDCEYWWNRYYRHEGTITFFGFEEDANLAVYFYKFIVEAALKAKDEYKGSEAYNERKAAGVAPRSISAAFITGFMLRMKSRITDMYCERETQMNQNRKHGLVLYEKKKKVNDQFNELGMNIRSVASTVYGAHHAAQQDGAKAANKVSITQGMSTGKQNTTKKLN